MDSKETTLDEIRTIYITYTEQIEKPLIEVDDDDDDIVKANAKNELKCLFMLMLKKIEGLLSDSKASSDDHDRYTVMKAFLLNTNAYLMYEDLLKNDDHIMNFLSISDEVCTLLTPFIEDTNKIAMVIYPFIEAATHKANALHALRSDGEEDPSKEIFENNVALSKQFIESGHKLKDVWYGKKAFGISDEEADKQSDSFKKYHRGLNLNLLMKKNWWHLGKLLTADSTSRCLKYALPTLGITFRGMKAALQAKRLKTMAVFLDYLTGVIHHLIATRSFKQANELLAVAIHYSVNMVRNFSSSEINEAMFKNRQGKLSFQYAKLGETIADMSLKHLNGDPAIKLELEEVMKKSDSKSALATEMIEEGVENYLNEIPMKLIDNVEDIKNVLQMALAWNRRATNLMEKNETVKMELKAQKDSLKSLSLQT